MFCFGLVFNHFGGGRYKLLLLYFFKTKQNILLIVTQVP